MIEPAKHIVVLDTTPLGLLTMRAGVPNGDRCREWVVTRAAQGTRFCVPEIVMYEMRRELLRKGSSVSLAALDRFVFAEPDRQLRLNSPALKLAAELWAGVRRQGRPTAAATVLDIDVILAAQVLTAGWATFNVVVATANRKHLALFVPAAEWADI